MAFSAAYASRLTTRLAPGAFATVALAYASERGTARATAVASRHAFLSTTAAARSSRWNNHILSQQRCFASSSSPSSTTPPKSGGGFVEWYEGHLQKNPIPTKMVTGSVLWSLGDAVAQTVPVAAAGDLDMATFRYDWMRTGRAFAFGFILHAPASHVHFNFLEWMTVRAGVTGMKIPVFKVSEIVSVSMSH